MTTVAMVADMIPTALALSEGGGSRQPMSITVIGGLIMSTVLTLVIIPPLFSLAVGVEARLGPKLKARLTTGGRHGICCCQSLTLTIPREIMRSATNFAILAFLVFSTSSSARSGPAANDPALTLVRNFSDARARFDGRALEALLAPDYVEISPRGELDRRPEVLGFYVADKASPVPPMTLGVQDVRRYGDTAIVIGSVRVRRFRSERGYGQANGAGHVC